MNFTDEKPEADTAPADAPAATPVATTEVTTTITDTAPVVPAAPVAVVVVPAEPKKGGAGKCFLIGCLVVIICCVLTIVLGYFGTRMGGAAFLSSNRTADPTLTRFTNATAYQTALDNVTNAPAPAVDQTTGDVTVRFSESDILAMLVEGLQDGAHPEQVGVKITPGDLKVDIDLAILGQLTATDNAPASNSALDPQVLLKNVLDSFKGAYAGIDLGVASDAKSIIVKNVSTGNSIIDSIFGTTIKQNLQDSLQSSLSGDLGQSDATTTITKLILANGYLEATFRETPATSPAANLDTGAP